MVMKTTGLKKYLQLLLFQVALLGPVFCGKILVWPTEGSHWLNMNVIIQELIRRGHSFTILVSNATLFIEPRPKATENFETYNVPFKKDVPENLINGVVDLWLNNRPTILTFWKFYKELGRLSVGWQEMNKIMCDAVLTNKDLIARLQGSGFDLLLSDPVTPCGELLALKLGIPFVYSLRFSPAFTLERHCGKIPTPPSYTPAALSELTDHMSFGERVKNFVSYHLQDYVFQSYWGHWDIYYSKVLGRPTTLCETMGKAEIWLIRTYWDFEFPRPFLPNFEFVGGLHCQPAKPLPKEMEEFVQSSGEHGVIVFTLGSMVYNLSDEKSTVIAKALSQLPQKVLWRYKGKKPETLGSNTRIYDWIPQNDLLGHPLTKAFITHGGTNGLYEAIYHGIPMVGIPMFADQHDNIAHMVAKGAAVQVDFNTMKTQDLVDALNTVIYNSTYKENALKLSKIQHDQPVKPLDRAVFWIEFVMRHKGAKHLRPAAHHLTWYQYHSLDVLAFLFICTATIVFILFKCCLCCCRRCGRIAKRKKE
ncbi:UDP-glucuronosyltransferase 2A2-like isoform X1 [Oenanthe melanoleuca]|uniref:UDP-glucuronosyltransferase 2A2-like isoform X1 n=1 Tax=Oenanthe melanoleuca TaxID=2939378 RepID=UPI0024C20640|nr:UDP-glucuronosyltransferase 2A2-like isoform X1 [Oenanthe melanoleuca]XP_056346816.1 UDP-glucuronosyltransferase 2A2-like isoform X1 [Oenanthe melanoleuca]